MKSVLLDLLNEIKPICFSPHNCLKVPFLKRMFTLKYFNEEFGCELKGHRTGVRLEEWVVFGYESVP